MGVISTQLCLRFTLFLFFSAHSFLGNFTEEEEDVKRSHFPDGFLFGIATSSYQIEGAFLEDGKSLSNWDVFNHINVVSGETKNVDNGDVADDHYHRYLEDIEIMHNLGVDLYRFSISWSRILPRGRFGKVNPNGVMFYNKILDNLLLKGIEPFVTIHHQDFPHEFEGRFGSWLSPTMQEELVYFAEICFKSFGDRVKYWSTINEPNLFSDMGYIRGRYPPARCSVPFGNCSVGNSDLEPLIAMHHMLLAHAKTAKLYRERFQGGFIGIVECMFMYESLTGSDLDHDAATRALAFSVGWTVDPLVFGDYPPEMRHYHGNELPSFTAEEKENIIGSIDFIGINHYSTFYASDCIHSKCSLGEDHAIRGFASSTTERDGIPIGDPTGMPTFSVVSRGMEKIVDYVKNRYDNMPMFVTENGYSPPLSNQEVSVEEQLQDVKRVEFHKSYLSSLARAIKNGADVRGYLIWSLMDNYEWVEGYHTKFGVYYIDRKTLERIPKLSAKWYRNFLTNYSKSNEDAISKDSFRNKKITVYGLKARKADI